MPRNKLGLNHILALVSLIALIWLAPLLLAQGNALIMPGEGVGVLRLGEPISFVKQDLENVDPSTSRLIEEGGQRKVALSYRNHGLTLIFDFKTKQLGKIIVQSQRLLVENTGIHVGSRASDVVRYFKDPVKGSENEMDYPQLGINFILDKSGMTISAIEVKPAVVRAKAVGSDPL